MGVSSSVPTIPVPNIQYLSDLVTTYRGAGERLRRKPKYIILLGDRHAHISEFVSCLAKDKLISGDSQMYTNSSFEHIRAYSFQYHQWSKGLTQEVCLFCVPSFTDSLVRNAEIWFQLIALLHVWEVTQRDLIGVMYFHDFAHGTSGLHIQNMEILDALIGSENRDRCITVTSRYTISPSGAWINQGSAHQTKGTGSIPTVRFDGRPERAKYIIGLFPYARFIPAVSAEIIDNAGPKLAIYCSAAGRLIHGSLAQIMRSEKSPQALEKIGLILSMLEQPPEQQASSKLAHDFARLELKHNQNRLRRKKKNNLGFLGSVVLSAFLMPLAIVPVLVIYTRKIPRWEDRKERQEHQEVSALGFRAWNSIQNLGSGDLEVAKLDALGDVDAKAIKEKARSRPSADGPSGKSKENLEIEDTRNRRSTRSDAASDATHQPHFDSQQQLPPLSVTAKISWEHEPESAPSLPQPSFRRTHTDSASERDEAISPPSYIDVLRERLPPRT